MSLSLYICIESQSWRLGNDISKKVFGCSHAEGEDEGAEVLGLGTTAVFFYSVQNTPVYREELKITERVKDIDWAVDLSIIAKMLSGPAEMSVTEQVI